MKNSLEDLNNRNHLPLILLCLVILSGLLRIFSFSVGINTYDLHDYIEGVFWADATLRSGSVINPDYVYYYIVPFGPNLIMALFVALFGVSFVANQLGMLVYYLIYLAVLFRLSRILFEENRNRLIFCAVISLFIYTYVGDNLLHHIISYGIGFVCFLGALSCVIEINKGKKSRMNMILLVIFCLWSSSNGPATAALSCFPILMSLIYSGYKYKTLFTHKKRLLYLSLVLSILAGLMIYTYFDSKASSLHMYDLRFLLAKPEDMVKHLTLTLIADYLRTFYYHPDSTSLFSFSGITSLLMLVFSISVIACPIYISKKNRNFLFQKGNEETECFVVVANLFIVFICISQYVLFDNPVNRYLFNGILSLFFLTAIGSANIHEKGRSCRFLFLIFVFSLLMTCKLIFHTIPMGNEKKTELIRINDLLTEEELSYGYAFHRSFKTIELLSREKKNISVISFDKQKEKLIVNNDRIYVSEKNCPVQAEKFFVIKENSRPGSSLLEKWSIDKVSLDSVNVYIFNTTDWDKLFEAT